jgi:hypothetical protein
VAEQRRKANADVAAAVGRADTSTTPRSTNQRAAAEGISEPGSASPLRNQIHPPEITPQGVSGVGPGRRQRGSGGPDRVAEGRRKANAAVNAVAGRAETGTAPATPRGGAGRGDFTPRQSSPLRGGASPGPGDTAPQLPPLRPSVSSFHDVLGAFGL